MKKFRFAAVAALIFAVTALTGCEIFKEFSYNKWCKKEVTLKEKSTTAYFYWATDDEDENIKKGLNVVLQFQGDAVSVLGTEVSNGKYYIVKNIPDGTVVDDLDDTELDEEKSQKYKDVKITSGKWAAAYATVFKKGLRNIDGPVCLSESDWNKPADESAVNLKEVIANALIGLLEAVE